MPFKVIALALPLLAFQSGAFAQSMEKNSLPCVAEICIGDGITELAKLPLAPAQQVFKVNNKAVPTSAHKLSDDDLRILKLTYPNASGAAPYLYEKQFDNEALAGLTLVGTACDANEIFGSYGANTGAPTRVGISLQPSPADPARQAWTVTTIVREFPSAVTNEQKADVTHQLNLRYARFGAGSRELPAAKPGEGRFFLGGRDTFGFGLALVRAPDEVNRLKLHPLCVVPAK